MYISKRKPSQILSVFELPKDGIPANSFSVEELQTIENFAVLIPNKVNEVKNHIIDFLEKVECTDELKNIAQDIKDKWTTLHVLLSDKNLREDVLKTQKTSSEKILLPGIGAAYIEKGIISQIIADTKIGLSIISFSNTKTAKEDGAKIKILLNKIEELYVILMPRPQP